jgi:aspartate aminotransferase-like enzyme
MNKRLLMTPGPTPIPPSVLRALSQPIIHHRTPEFKALFSSCADDLKPIFATEQPVLMLSSSGTGAMEASITNFTRRGDTIITVAAGKFGQRWGAIGRAYGLNVVELTVEWGHAVTVQAVADALTAHPEAVGVYFQSSETATATTHPVQAIAALCRTRANTLCVVDGITAVGVQPLAMDEWGVDIVLSGSQKAFMLPPGLAFIAASEKAWAQAASADHPRFYFDLPAERAKQAGGQTVWTSPVGLIQGLRAVLDIMIENGGLAGLHAHHDRLARATQAGVQALGLTLFSQAPAWSCTAVRAPDAIGAGPIIQGLNDRGIKVAGGQDHVKGKIFRIGHLGWFDGKDILTTLASLESVLLSLGHEFEQGASITACSAVLSA